MNNWLTEDFYKNVFKGKNDFDNATAFLAQAKLKDASLKLSLIDSIENQIYENDVLLTLCFIYDFIVECNTNNLSLDSYSIGSYSQSGGQNKMSVLWQQTRSIIHANLLKHGLLDNWV